jgi:hypothetical protein
MVEARELVECEIGFMMFGPESSISLGKPKIIFLATVW